MVRSGARSCKRETTRTPNYKKDELVDGRRHCKCKYGRRADNGQCLGPPRKCKYGENANRSQVTKSGRVMCNKKSERAAAKSPKSRSKRSRVKSQSAPETGSKPSTRGGRKGHHLKWDEFVCVKHGRVLCNFDTMRYSEKDGKLKVHATCSKRGCGLLVKKNSKREFIDREGIPQAVVTGAAAVPVVPGGAKFVPPLPTVPPPLPTGSPPSLPTAAKAVGVAGATIDFVCNSNKHSNNFNQAIPIADICYVRDETNFMLVSNCKQCHKRITTEGTQQLINTHKISSCKLPTFTCKNTRVHAFYNEFTPLWNDVCVDKCNTKSLNCKLYTLCPECGESCELISTLDMIVRYDITQKC